MMSASRIRGVFLRYYHNLRKGVHSLADLFYWPLVDILLWGLTAVWIENHTTPVSNITLVLMTGLIFWLIIWRGSTDISVNLLQEFWNRNLINLFSNPLKISEWITGIILLSICKLLVTIAFGGIVVFFLYSLNVFSLGWMFIPFAASLVLFGWAIGFFASGILIYWGQQLEMIAWMIPFIFSPFCAVFYPVSILPIWAQKIAWTLPPTYIFEGMRQLLAGSPFPASFLTISFIINMPYLFASMFFFNWMFEKSRVKGLSRLE